MSKSVSRADIRDKYKIRIPYTSGNVEGSDELRMRLKKFLLSKTAEEYKSKEVARK